ncbi:MAG TPA: hypothetical protein VGG25_15215 [Streptosporangiaceae bacterium]
MSDTRYEVVAGRVLTAMRERAAQAGLRRVICPVRPTPKARYPLTPMADFARWTRDGAHLDPWIRTHQRLGATILGPAPRSMVITGTVAAVRGGSWQLREQGRSRPGRRPPRARSRSAPGRSR